VSAQNAFFLGQLNAALNALKPESCCFKRIVLRARVNMVLANEPKKWAVGMIAGDSQAEWE